MCSFVFPPATRALAVAILWVCFGLDWRPAIDLRSVEPARNVRQVSSLVGPYFHNQINSSFAAKSKPGTSPAVLDESEDPGLAAFG